MYYVISFNFKVLRMTGLFATDNKQRAMDTRAAWEAESYQDLVYDEEVVAIKAPDLYTVERQRPEYFSITPNHNIDGCFFCRTFLGWTGDFPKMGRVEILSQNARMHGHCLLCHQAYPVWHVLDRKYQLDRGLVHHLSVPCPVLDITVDHGSVDSI